MIIRFKNSKIGTKLNASLFKSRDSLEIFQLFLDTNDNEYNMQD